MKYIGVLDCNNFFVSCERVFRPDLWQRPVVVLSSNDGCIVARSQEVKDKGIPMGVPYFKVKDELSLMNTTVFSSHFALYRDLSQRVFAVLRELLADETIEEYSIDEAFFTINGTLGEIEERLRTIRTELMIRTGIPVSIGCASSKTQAKWASERAKKTDGVCVLSAATFLELAGAVPLREVWGVGGRLSQRFTLLQITTVGELVASPATVLATQFGVGGTRLQSELMGRPAFPVQLRCEAPKSLMSSRSFRCTTSDLSVLADAVAYHVRHAVAELRAKRLQARVLRVSIRPSRHGNYCLRGGSREVVLTVPTADTFVFLRQAQRVLTELYEPGVPYQKAGICLLAISSSDTVTEPLFSNEEVLPAKRCGAVLSVCDELNTRYGRELLTIGGRLKTDRWQARAELRSPAYTTRWEAIPRVLAK